MNIEIEASKRRSAVKCEDEWLEAQREHEREFAKTVKAQRARLGYNPERWDGRL